MPHEILTSPLRVRTMSTVWILFRGWDKDGASMKNRKRKIGKRSEKGEGRGEGGGGTCAESVRVSDWWHSICAIGSIFRISDVFILLARENVASPLSRARRRSSRHGQHRSSDSYLAGRCVGPVAGKRYREISKTRHPSPFDTTVDAVRTTARLFQPYLDGWIATRNKRNCCTYRSF